MPESLFATFTSIDTFSQHLYSEVATKFLAVLEAVSDCLRRAVDSNRNAINSSILDSLCQCLAGESDEAQFQATGHRLFRFKVDGHPNRGRVKWKKAVEPDCGLQANDAIGYPLTRSAQNIQLNIPSRHISWGFENLRTVTNLYFHDVLKAPIEYDGRGPSDSVFHLHTYGESKP